MSLCMRCVLCAVLFAFGIATARPAHAQNNPAGNAAATAAAEHQRQVEEQERRGQRAAESRRTWMGLDLAHLFTKRVRRLKPVPCRLDPDDDRAWACTKLLEGPALLVGTTWWSQYGPFVRLEVASFKGENALADGSYEWWTKWDGLTPLVIGPGEVLYYVGKMEEQPPDHAGFTLTFYRE